jgi:hypothetical protein
MRQQLLMLPLYTSDEAASLAEVSSCSAAANSSSELTAAASEDAGPEPVPLTDAAP